MDLMSLPNEMLASVLKYSADEDLDTVRGLSNRIDAIARKYRMNLLNLSSLRIRCMRCYDEQSCNCAFIKMKPVQPFYNQTNAARIMAGENNKRLPNGKQLSSQQLEQILSKLRKLRHLAIGKHVIDEDVLKVITKYSHVLRKSSLLLLNCEIAIPPVKLKIFANLAKLSKINIADCKFRKGYSFNDEVVTGFNPSMEVVLKGTDSPLITAKSFYSRVYSDKLNLSIQFMKTSTTFKDMVHFFKKFKNIRGYINFGAIEEVPNDFKNALQSEFGNCSFLHHNNIGLVIAGFHPSMNVILGGVDGSSITEQNLYNRVHENKFNLSLLQTFGAFDRDINFGRIQGVPNDLTEVEEIFNSEIGKGKLNLTFGVYKYQRNQQPGIVRFDGHF